MDDIRAKETKDRPKGGTRFEPIVLGLFYAVFYQIVLFLSVPGRSIDILVSPALWAHTAFLAAFFPSARFLLNLPLRTSWSGRVAAAATEGLVLVPFVTGSVYALVYGLPLNVNTLPALWFSDLDKSLEFAQLAWRTAPLALSFFAVSLAASRFWLGFLLRRDRLFSRLHVPVLRPCLTVLVCVMALAAPLGIRPYGGAVWILKNMEEEFFHTYYRALVWFSAYQLRFAASAEPMDFVELAKHRSYRNIPIGEKERELYVLVLGESAAKRHWSAYGYERATTPFADRLRRSSEAGWNTVFWENARTDSVMTNQVVSEALSFCPGDRAGSEFFMPSPKEFLPFLAVMRAQGFETSWISNSNVFNLFDAGSLFAYASAERKAFTVKTASDLASTVDDPRMKRQAAKRRSKRLFDGEHGNGGKGSVHDGSKGPVYDGELLPLLEEALARPAPKKFIVLHLRGSHLIYNYRYPPYESFFSRTPDRPVPSESWTEAFRTEPNHERRARRFFVNAYDDSIRYTDKILSKIWERIQTTETPIAWMLYFSDHGEDVYDTRNISWRSPSNPTPSMTEIPLFGLFSDEWSRRISQDVELDGTRPVNLRYMPYMLASLTGVRVDRVGDRRIDMSKSPVGAGPFESPGDLEISPSSPNTNS